MRSRPPSTPAASQLPYTVATSTCSTTLTPRTHLCSCTAPSLISTPLASPRPLHIPRPLCSPQPPPWSSSPLGSNGQLLSWSHHSLSPTDLPGPEAGPVLYLHLFLLHGCSLILHARRNPHLQPEAFQAHFCRSSNQKDRLLPAQIRSSWGL